MNVYRAFAPSTPAGVAGTHPAPDACTIWEAHRHFRTLARPPVRGPRTKKQPRRPDFQADRSPPITRPTTTILFAALLTGALPGVFPAQAQRLQGGAQQNPIYLADSPIAEESLERLPQLLARDNLDEAVRLVDEVITEFGDRLIPADPDDPDRVHIHVRDRVHRVILEHPDLLEAYRRRISPPARVWLNEGDWLRVETQAWLTEPGFIATARHAQTLIEAARFHAGMALLSSLEDHPDAEALAPQASALARLGAKYLDEEDAWELASRWAQRAGEPPIEQRPVAPPATDGDEPPRARLLDWTARDRQGSVSLSGIVPGPIARAPLTPEVRLDRPSSSNPGSIRMANWDPTSWVAPVAVGNNLYTNDGITISCFDRFTLRPVWRVQTTADTTDLPITTDSRTRLGRIIEDTTSITAVDGDLYTAAGIPKSGDRDGDQLLYKLNAATGEVVWSVDITSIDPALSEASIRGPVIVDGGMVVVSARTSNRRQRLISLALVGLDAATGDARWVRQVATAGSLPFQQMGQLAHNPVVRDGVAYWSDHIGVAYAAQIATGRLLWARPLPAPDLYARSMRASYAGNSPVINPHGLFVLTTDGSQIIQIDPDTGHTIAQRPADPAGESLYLLDISDDLFAGVGPESVTVYRPDRFSNASVIKGPGLGGDDGFRGRLIAIGGRIIAPVRSGVHVLEPERGDHGEFIELDHTGNILALDGQILVFDESDAFSFLSWDTASRLLDGRIAQDPGAAITLAELAYRARRPASIVPAVERAIRVLRTEPLEERRALEAHLFAVLLDMVDPDRAPAEDDGDDPGPAWSVGTENTIALLGLMGDLASTHEQVVAHRMALGSFHELRSDRGSAIAAYQDILDQPALNATMWEGAGIAMRGGLEATRRIGRLLAASGYTPYEPFDHLAVAEREFLTAQAEPAELERLAARYPWSTIAPDLWLESAALLEQRGRVPAMINAANQGLAAAGELAELGIDTGQTTIDRLAGHAVSGLIATNRPDHARDLARSLAERYPAITLRIDGRAVTPDELSETVAAADRLPTLGDAFLRGEPPVLATGSPIEPAMRIDPGGVVFYAPQLGRIEYARVGRGGFESVWTRRSPTNQPPLIPWQDTGRVLIFWPEGTESRHAGTLEAIDTISGETAWSITDLRFQLTQNSTRVADDQARTDSSFPTPVHGPVPTSQLLVATDGHTIIVTDRIGRAMGVDLHSGEQLWYNDLPANRIHDLDLDGGVLGICGLMVVDRAVHQHEGSAGSVAASIDPRTGDPIQVVDRFGQQPRWVLVSPSGNLYVATRERIMAINTKAGNIDWSLHDEEMVETTAAWISTERLLVLDVANALWPIDIGDGTRADAALNTRGRISSRGWLQLRPSIDRTTLAGSRGLMVFDHAGEVIAADPMAGAHSMLGVAWAGSNAVFAREPLTEGDQSRIDLHLLDIHQARLLDTTTLTLPAALDRTPTSLLAVDGGVIVGLGEVSVFVRTEFSPR